MATPDIAATRVRKTFGAAVAVDDVSFAVEPGHVVSLLGPSGCGKTTMMRMIAGLAEPDAGDIAIKGRSIRGVPVHKRNVGMLFQSYALFPHLDVSGNVAFGLRMRRMARAEIDRRVKDALAMVRLESFATRMPHMLSGGQQQRVALARALVIEPSVLLLDEPFGALDKKLRDSMQIELLQLQRRLAITTLMVTHDQDEALTLSDRIAVMRDGRIAQFGSPEEIYRRPASRFVAGFIGTSNFFKGRVTGRDAGGFRVESGSTELAVEGAPPQDDVLVSVRPESIRILPPGAPAANQAGAVVEQIIYRGLSTQFLLRLKDGEMLSVMRQNEDGGGLGLSPGAAVLASWDADRNHVVADD